MTDASMTTSQARSTVKGGLERSKRQTEDHGSAASGFGLAYAEAATAAGPGSRKASDEASAKGDVSKAGDAGTANGSVGDAVREVALHPSSGRSGASDRSLKTFPDKDPSVRTAGMPGSGPQTALSTMPLPETGSVSIADGANLSLRAATTQPSITVTAHGAPGPAAPQDAAEKHLAGDTRSGPAGKGGERDAMQVRDLDGAAWTARFGPGSRPIGETGRAVTRVDFVSLRTDFAPAAIRMNGSASVSGDMADVASRIRPLPGKDDQRHGQEGDTRAAAGATAAGKDGSNGLRPLEGLLARFGSAMAASSAGSNSAGSALGSEGKAESRAEGSRAAIVTGGIAPPEGTGLRDGRNPHDNAGSGTGAGRGEKGIPFGQTSLRAAQGSDPIEVKAATDSSDPLSGQIAASLSSGLKDMRASSMPGHSAPGQAGANDPQAASGAGRAPLAAGGQALKTLQIQLQPETLGRLDVTMKLTNGTLAIHLVASEPDTALRLRDDTEGLKKLLSKAGFSIDDAAISVAARDMAGKLAPGQPVPSHQPGQNANGHGANDHGANGQGTAGQGGQSDAQPQGQAGQGRPDPRGAGSQGQPRQDGDHRGRAEREQRRSDRFLYL